MNICIGKLSQSPIQKTVAFVQGEEWRTQIFTDDSLEVSSCFAVTDSCDQITYQKKDSNLRSNRRSQMCVNASVTTFARIYFNQALRKLQAAGIEPLYCDTGKLSKIDSNPFVKFWNFPYRECKKAYSMYFSFLRNSFIFRFNHISSQKRSWNSLTKSSNSFWPFF